MSNKFALTRAAQAYAQYRLELVPCGCSPEQPLFAHTVCITTLDEFITLDQLAQCDAMLDVLPEQLSNSLITEYLAIKNQGAL